jgi:hypothetical protein
LDFIYIINFRVIYSILSGTVLLCDETSLLAQLKLNLTNTICDQRIHNVNYECLVDTKNQMEN